jgi:hypothetical protein
MAVQDSCPGAVGRVRVTDGAGRFWESRGFGARLKTKEGCNNPVDGGGSVEPAHAAGPLEKTSVHPLQLGFFAFNIPVRRSAVA